MVLHLSVTVAAAPRAPGVAAQAPLPTAPLPTTTAPPPPPTTTTAPPSLPTAVPPTAAAAQAPLPTTTTTAPPSLATAAPPPATTPSTPPPPPTAAAAAAAAAQKMGFPLQESRYNCHVSDILPVTSAAYKLLRQQVVFNDILASFLSPGTQIC